MSSITMSKLQTIDHELRKCEAELAYLLASINDAYRRISEDINAIIDPLQAETNYGLDRGGILPKGYLRNFLRPTDDGEGWVACNAASYSADWEAAITARQFIVNYLENKSVQSKNDIESLIRAKVDSFFALRLWMQVPESKQQLQDWIRERFGFVQGVSACVIDSRWFN